MWRKRENIGLCGSSEQPASCAYIKDINTNSKGNYTQIEKECLAIMFACHCLNWYLSRQDKNTVESDHKPFQSIFKISVLAALSR